MSRRPVLLHRSEVRVISFPAASVVVRLEPGPGMPSSFRRLAIRLMPQPETCSSNTRRTTAAWASSILRTVIPLTVSRA